MNKWEKIYMINSMNNQEIENSINKDKNEILKQELETKNRVDISLKEYEQLKKQKNNLESELNYYRNFFDKLPEEIVDIILHKKYKSAISIKDPKTFNTVVNIVFEEKWGD